MKKINCFIAAQSEQQVAGTVAALRGSDLVGAIYLLTTNGCEYADCTTLNVDNLNSSSTVAQVIAHADCEFALVYTKYTTLELGQYALERLVNIAESTEVGMVYYDYYQIGDGIRSKNTTSDYQVGSLRDDFDFGSLIVYNAAALRGLTMGSYDFAGWYDTRLKLSQKSTILHINEYLYSEVEQDNRKSGERQFDYVDPKNRAVQIEMEQACTEHLKAIGGYLAPVFKSVDFDAYKAEFSFEASVIIPVRNRVSTIGDAIKSVLSQECDFKFNLIIIDNHSTDVTTEFIKVFAVKE